MKAILAYKLEYFGGPLNGAVRYYKDLSIAVRVAKSYVTRNRDYPEQIGYYISELYTDYTTKIIISV